MSHLYKYDAYQNRIDGVISYPLSPWWESVTVSSNVTQKRYHAYYSNNGAQSISTSTPTTLNWGETRDSSNPPSNSSGVFTPTKAGYWLIVYQANWTSNATGVRQSWIAKNNNDDLAYAIMSYAASSGGNGSPGSSCAVVYFNGSTDNFAIRVWQNSGSSLNIGGTDSNFLQQNLLNCHFLHE
jgi:hypothetical protein